MREADRLNLGVTMLAVADALPELQSGALVRVTFEWYADAGAISVYYSSRKLLPAKTHAFVDWVAADFKSRRLAQAFAGSFATAI